MLPIELESLRRYTREKIESITRGKYEVWMIGISMDMTSMEDKEANSYSFPCLSHELAAELMDEYVEKGMKTGKVYKKGISLLLQKQ
jgi:hypothetical protein